MDGARFDDLTRSLAINRTRRQAMKGALALGLVGVTGRLAADEAALAALRKTARCPIPSEPGDKMYSEATGQVQAQTFKPKIAGKLARVDIVVNFSPSDPTIGDYIVRIVRLDSSGAPDLDSVLAETSIPSTGLGGGENTLTARFNKSTAPRLKENRKYAVAVSLSDSSRWHLVHSWNGSPATKDSCPKSVFYQKVGSNSFQLQDSSDVVFAVYVAA